MSLNVNDVFLMFGLDLLLLICFGCCYVVFGRMIYFITFPCVIGIEMVGWLRAEVGYQEYESSNLLQESLLDHGFKIQNNVANDINN